MNHLVWRTSDELLFLYELAVCKKEKALRGYLCAAETYHRDWAGMDSRRIIAYARQVLDCVLAGVDAPPPRQLEG